METGVETVVDANSEFLGTSCSQWTVKGLPARESGLCNCRDAWQTLPHSLWLLRVFALPTGMMGKQARLSETISEPGQEPNDFDCHSIEGVWRDEQNNTGQ